AGGDRALQSGDDLVEIIECAERDQAHAAGLRRTRIDVVEMLEAVRIFELAEQREAVPPLAAGRCLLRPCGRQQGQARRPEQWSERREGAGVNKGTTGQGQG